MSNECTGYIQEYYEYFVPSPIIFASLCTNYDKTQLFIVSLIRMIIWIIIDMIVANLYVESSAKFFNMLDDIIKFYSVINIIYIAIVIAKKPNADLQFLNSKKYAVLLPSA